MFIGILVVVSLVLVAIWLLNKPKEDYLQGRVEADEIYLSAKIASRLESTKIKEGASVKKGQLLAVLESPELEARGVQAMAARDAATAQMNKATNGARSQEVAAARSIYEKAKAAADVNVKTYERVENLFRDGVVSEQKKDEAYARKEAAVKDMEAAYNQYTLAKEGARREDIASASAMVQKAEGAVSELKSFQSEKNIVAPIDAEVMDFLPQPGELIGPGAPVVHLVDLANAYVVLNVKENELSHFKKDSEFVGKIPALENTELRFRIYYVAALGDYATWNATKASGDFDVRTFEIKAEPLDKDAGLRPGMSVLVKKAD